jgi:hypothetical protein
MKWLKKEETDATIKKLEIGRRASLGIRDSFVRLKMPPGFTSREGYGPLLPPFPRYPVVTKYRIMTSAHFCAPGSQLSDSLEASLEAYLIS